MMRGILDLIGAVPGQLGDDRSYRKMLWEDRDAGQLFEPPPVQVEHLLDQSRFYLHQMVVAARRNPGRNGPLEVIITALYPASEAEQFESDEGLRGSAVAIYRS